MKPEPGQVVMGTTWDGKERPCVFLEKRGGDAVVIPLTSKPNDKGAYVYDWRVMGLYRECWLWTFMHRLPPSSLSLPPAGELWVTSGVAAQIVAQFPGQLRTTTAAQLLEDARRRETAA